MSFLRRVSGLSLRDRVSFICSLVKYQPLTFNRWYVYPNWAYRLSWAMALSSILLVPGWVLVQLWAGRRNLKQVSLNTGDEALEVYNNFMFEEGDEMKLDTIIEKFEAYCIPKRNVTYERHRFFTCVKKPGETIDQYVTELRNRSKSCEFGELTDSLIKDRIGCGIPDSALHERLLSASVV
ncbi:hypothetical protein SRHO_G00081850 [Serrasalmus rhombeus]